MVVLLAVLGLATYFAGPSVSTALATDQGQFTVEVLDDDVELVIKHGGKEIKIVDTRLGRTINLKSGKYRGRLASRSERSGLVDKPVRPRAERHGDRQGTARTRRRLRKTPLPRKRASLSPTPMSSLVGCVNLPDIPWGSCAWPCPKTASI